jgi:hypothetical protein
MGRKAWFAAWVVMIVSCWFGFYGKARAEDRSPLHVMFVKADVTANTVTFKTTDKAGKTSETTLPLAKNAKVIGEDKKAETLAAFARNMQKHKDKPIVVVEDKSGKQILEIQESPAK